MDFKFIFCSKNFLTNMQTHQKTCLRMKIKNGLKIYVKSGRNNDKNPSSFISFF